MASLVLAAFRLLLSFHFHPSQLHSHLPNLIYISAIFLVSLSISPPLTAPGLTYLSGGFQKKTLRPRRTSRKTHGRIPKNGKRYSMVCASTCKKWWVVTRPFSMHFFYVDFFGASNYCLWALGILVDFCKYHLCFQANHCVAPLINHPPTPFPCVINRRTRRFRWLRI